MKSMKPIKMLSELTEEKLFIIPATLANGSSGGKPCIDVRVNGKNTAIPVGEFTRIEYSEFCLLVDVGITINEFTEEFNPCN